MAAMNAGKRVRQRFPRPEEIIEALEQTREEHPQEYEFSCNLFEVFVNPEVIYNDAPTPDELVRLNAAFTEWFLFDCDVLEGRTPFEVMAKDDPTLAECAQTQFYSRFWVVERDAERKQVTLRDMATCEDYIVRSTHIARNERWAKGTLGTRIAQAHGVWHEIGQMVLHDNAPSEPLPQAEERKGHVQHDATAFIKNLEQLLGRRGAYADTLESFEY